MDLDNTATPGLQDSQHKISKPIPPGGDPGGPSDREMEQEMPSTDLQVICALITLELV